MTLDQLNGLIDAVEAESKNPNPSHQNLARLCWMFFREIVQHLQPPEPTVTITQATAVETPPVLEPNDDSVVEKDKPKRGRKKS